MKKVVYVILGILIGISIGLAFPYCWYTECTGIFDVCKHSFADWLLRIVEVLGLALAVVVALFKEDLTKLWHQPKLEIHMDSNEIMEERGECDVDKYYAKFRLQNLGAAISQDTELFLSQIRYVNHNGIGRSIWDEDINMLWNNGERRLDIPVKGNKVFEWLQLLPLKRISDSVHGDTLRPMSMILGGMSIPPDCYDGTFNIKFRVSGSNIEPIEITIRLVWDGQWQNSQSKLLEHLNFEMIN